MNVARIIEQARSAGLDPALVLRWRMDFEERPRKHVRRPKGLLSMSDVKKKYGLTQVYIAALRRDHGLPTTKKAHLILVQEATLKAWMARFPPRC